MRSVAVCGIVLSASFTGACAAPSTRRVLSPAGDSQAAASAASRLVVLALASGDRRVGRRFGVSPNADDVHRLVMGSLLSEDATVALLFDGVDPFSFEARAKAIALAREHLEASRGIVPPSEHELLGRLIAEEAARLDDERALPGAASALVRAVVSSWQEPSSQESSAALDRLLTRRLEDVRRAVLARGLNVVRARELDDALNPLERAAAASGLQSAAAELVVLREALESLANRPAAVVSAPDARGRTDRLAARLQASFGPRATLEQLAARLESCEPKSAKAIEVDLDLVAHKTRDEIAESAAALVLDDAACPPAKGSSWLRSAGPSTERVPACRLQHVVAQAESGVARALASAATHDHVTLALWAIDVAQGARSLEQSQAAHPLFSRPAPERLVRWQRLAASAPLTAITGGIAACILAESAVPKARAATWLSLGDVPVDIAERELLKR
jgi:hypothetical protein